MNSTDVLTSSDKVPILIIRAELLVTAEFDNVSPVRDLYFASPGGAIKFIEKKPV